MNVNETKTNPSNEQCKQESSLPKYKQPIAMRLSTPSPRGKADCSPGSGDDLACYTGAAAFGACGNGSDPLFGI
jgi:hypothetical protein